jgi:hypothetical protein
MNKKYQLVREFAKKEKEKELVTHSTNIQFNL